MGRDENIEIFEDTEKLCKANDTLKASIENSRENQKLILENNLISIKENDLNKYTTPAKVMVSQKRSFDAAKAYSDKKVCVLNFASASNPGGGVTKGSTAQEECLCRCSTLYFSLNTKEMWDGFYSPHRNAGNPLHNDDIIYTPDVTVFKSDTANPTLLPKKDWYKVNVITCAAPNLRENPSNQMNKDGNKKAQLSEKELLELHEKRIKRILDVAVKEGNEVIILGAFGCGAFQNSPRIVARAAKNVIQDYLHAFQVIEFAVYCSCFDQSNYQAFINV